MLDHERALATDPGANHGAVEDIRVKLQRLQAKLQARLGVSSLVRDQNDFVSASIQELQSMDPAVQKLRRLQRGMTLDSSQSLNQAISQFATIKAHLNRLVASQDERITEVQDRAPREFFLVQEIPLNLKIKVHERPSPLKIFFSYPEGPAQKEANATRQVEDAKADAKKTIKQRNNE